MAIRRLFDFRCSACGTEDEYYTKTDDFSDVKCRHCTDDKATMTRLFSRPAGITHDRDGALKVPDGFKSLMKQTLKTVPNRVKRKNWTLGNY